MPDRSRFISPDGIDPVIHERVRLSILAALSIAQDISFNDLKLALELTDGNLSAHARKLEEAGYISIEKSFVNRKSYTVLRITDQGREAYRKYLEFLKQIIQMDERK